MTPIRAQVLDVIRRYTAQGSPPSLDEICREMGWKAKSAAHRAVTLLKREGVVDWEPRRAHSLRIISDGPSRATIEQWSDDELQRVHMVIRAVREARVVAKGRAAA